LRNGSPARNLGLLVKLQTPPAVAQRNCDRALGIGLPDDEAIELGDDFAG